VEWLEGDSSIRYLGVPVGTKPDWKIAWKNAIDKVAQVLGKWRRRNLTIQGRVLVLKTLAISKIQYFGLFRTNNKETRIYNPRFCYVCLFLERETREDFEKRPYPYQLRKEE